MGPKCCFLLNMPWRPWWACQGYKPLVKAHPPFLAQGEQPALQCFWLYSCAHPHGCSRKHPLLQNAASRGALHTGRANGPDCQTALSFPPSSPQQSSPPELSQY